MKRYSPYISVGLVACMFYVLYQIKRFSTMAEFATALHHNRILTLFSICGILALLLSLSGFKSVEGNLKYASYLGLGGSILIMLIVWIFPFFV